MAFIPRVVRSDLWIDPVFDERLRSAGADVSVFPVLGNPAAAYGALARAHVYQVSAAKDELPRAWWVSRELLAHCPQLVWV